ncbi:hypothetical protein AK812_SmicGene25122 [Symbiodinium microadriaticum]|uniref:Uncharacterized protein n=1 Tax=Symbiodinium microadriaticum TaxID=2951 RepID=A0A1Q9DCR7_SYMMI|nr:hypothetical protein AK812_SmicGene25122 [Symbiodinium microadriaticum]
MDGWLDGWMDGWTDGWMEVGRGALPASSSNKLAALWKELAYNRGLYEQMAVEGFMMPLTSKFLPQATHTGKLDPHPSCGRYTGSTGLGELLQFQQSSFYPDTWSIVPSSAILGSSFCLVHQTPLRLQKMARSRLGRGLAVAALWMAALSLTRSLAFAPGEAGSSRREFLASALTPVFDYDNTV